ncbi:MAG: hypothetical protein ABI612_11550 [Betaproteobacteria bacterium]
MKMDRSAVVIGAMALVIAVLVCALVYYARDELHLATPANDDDMPVQSHVEQQNGTPAVRVAKSSQDATGIATAMLQPAASQASAEVYGAVVNIQPLLDLRARYVAAAAEARALRAVAANSEAEYQRAKKLFDDDRNVAQRAVQSAEAQFKSDQARLAAADQTSIIAHESIRNAWGPVLAQWATNPESSAFSALTQQRDMLVALSFPYDLQAKAGKLPVSIAPVSTDVPQRPARYVSPAPQGDATLPGATFFYVVNANGLRVGNRLTARINLGSRSRKGVVIPATAVVWHGGKAWAYVRDDDDDDVFLRKAVDTSQELSGGWFNVEGFEPDEDIVVSGAQLLLSEELKFQIRNENED